MKILMLSIFAPHFFNWTEQLKDSGYEVYWFDIFDSNTRVEQIDFVEQIIGWRYKWNYPCRYRLKKNAPALTGFINIFNERDFQKHLEKQIEKIEPDVIHSFVMYLSGVPALPVMKKFPHIKWVYSSWGSDMYYYQRQPEHLEGMRKTLPYMDYMFADCQRDYNLAKSHGFKGKFMGVFPGGGGFDSKVFDSYIKRQESRNIILIKGYQGLHGKCISVLEAVQKLEKYLKSYSIVVFGAPQEVFEYVETRSLKDFTNLQVYGKIPQQKLIELMGQSLIYIGNSSSDGIPNTLLEAIVMGIFPIQSNPGGATAEIIEHKKNGLIITNWENINEISNLLLEAIKNQSLREKAITWNLINVKPRLKREELKNKVLKKYKLIESEIK
ncbi:glycosyltransferase family 4 protein [Salinimicrobium sp. 3283s]|uniref:glycosyltransferase family 4 protein n=1 Tax=Salinimicrobium sp. 3283s TaxID=3114359 RepID=UPI0031EF9664